MTRPMRGFVHTAGALALGFVIVGCAGQPKQLYEGPPRPESEVAVLMAMSPSRAAVYGIDGRRERANALAIEPGLHQILVSVREQVEAGDVTYFVYVYCGMQAELVAGHRYELRSVNEIVQVDSLRIRPKIGAKLVDPATGSEFRTLACGGKPPLDD